MDSAVLDSSASNPHISAVIFDLDGTLLNTEDVTKNIIKDFLARYGKAQDSEKEKKRLGMSFKDSSVAILNDYELPLTQEEYVQEILPMYRGSWQLAKPLPGANRLMEHLHKHGVPFALASNSLRKNIEGKISHHGWKENFTVILGSDQVESGKPAPDLFLEAAKGMGVDASRCLVIEDSIVGVKAGKAAGMNVVAVPSLPPNESDSYSIADTILHSLLEFHPEQWGLPPFQDWVDSALPTEPIHLTGVLTNGLFHAITDNGMKVLPNQIWGLYIGWAKLHEQKIFKAVIHIYFCGSEQTIQPYLINSDHVNKNDSKMQLLLVGYLRRSTHCYYTSSCPEILDEDKLRADAALDLPAFSHKLCESLFLGES